MRVAQRRVASLMIAVLVICGPWGPSAAAFRGANWLGSASLPSGLRVVPHPCADSYGDYSDPDYWDPELDCVLELSAGDLSAVTNSIQQWESNCQDEANYLYMTDLYEWTGNYFEAYEWEGFFKRFPEEYIGVHWPYLQDWYIWAHEGTHGTHPGWSEGEVAYYAYWTCTHNLY